MQISKGKKKSWMDDVHVDLINQCVSLQVVHHVSYLPNQELGNRCSIAVLKNAGWNGHLERGRKNHFLLRGK